jgi:hypothetical protein
MEPALQLLPGQERLTPEQEAEAQRFAHERIESQFATERVDEPKVERLVRRAYTVAGFPPPQQIMWVDGPLELQAMMATSSAGDRTVESVWTRVQIGVQAFELADLNRGWDPFETDWDFIDSSVAQSLWPRVLARVWDPFEKDVWRRVGTRVVQGIQERVRDDVAQGVWDRIGWSVRSQVEATWGHRIYLGAWVSLWAAYHNAARLAFSRFFAEYLVPNKVRPLAYVNELVSGYWLGEEVALLGRRPRVLARDQEGRLHSAAGKCLEYADGFGCYAWHGVQVPEQVILSPERLSRDDFLGVSNVEVRRVIQERMGERFVRELGGIVINSGPRGTLYEVPLPGDPERVARYVEVRDASTARAYVLRVPPALTTAAEAVAWSFALSVETYAPTQET